MRYHNSDIPEVDAKTWKVSIGGEGANGQLELTLDDLKKMPAFEIAAVNQCSGNRRGLFDPHVAGVEWGYGAMGCARWKGARLKDVLDKVGLKKEAIEIVSTVPMGLPLRAPDFVKSIPVWKALEETTLVAYEMNGQPLPHLQRLPGAPHRTRLDRHLLDEARHQDQRAYQAAGGFWMKSGLSHPAGQISAGGALHHAGNRRQHSDHRDGGELPDHQPRRRRDGEAGRGVGGIAWDGGYGIRGRSLDRRRQELDAGDARRGPRPLRLPHLQLAAQGQGQGTVMARASNAIGQTQTATLIFNPAGYHHNVMHSVTLNVA